MKSIAAVALSLLALLPLTLDAQRSARKPAAPKPRARPAAKPPAPARTERPVPFKAGETLTYDVSWSTYLTAGTAVFSVKEKRPSFDSTAYYIVAEGRPGPIVAKLYTLYYKLDTLLDSYTLLPQRGTVYSEEGSRKRFKISRFDHAAHKVFFEFQSGGTVKDTFTVPPYTQDALSAVYVLRAVPLKAGDVITMPVTDDGSNYKLQINSAGSERVKTPFAEVSASKLRLTITDSAGKQQGRNVAIWIGDDVRRLPVKIQAEVPVGTFYLNLRDAR
jgi:hypothetical protein